ncbi:MAG TPA: ECF-type sigma factor [Polyangiaceae bacterium]|nr:ECF-type sigma factor [Polyangiaceae bacterium]
MTANIVTSAAVYEVLHDLAHRQLLRSSGATLNTTALVHEAWIKLARGANGEFESRSHFLAVAAMAMRQVIVDYGRRRRAQRRGGGKAPVTESALSRVGVDANIEELLAIDAALDKLAALDDRLAKVVEFRLFAGLEEEEIADVLGVHVRTVRRDWRKARAFLLSEIAAS